MSIERVPASETMCQRYIRHESRHRVLLDTIRSEAYALLRTSTPPKLTIYLCIQPVWQRSDEAAHSRMVEGCPEVSVGMLTCRIQVEPDATRLEGMQDGVLFSHFGTYYLCNQRSRNFDTDCLQMYKTQVNDSA